MLTNLVPAPSNKINGYRKERTFGLITCVRPFQGGVAGERRVRSCRRGRRGRVHDSQGDTFRRNSETATP
jgi:hypothetical protein